MTDRLNRGLREHDIDSVSRAIEALRDAGFSIERLEHAAETRQGVTFSIEVYDPNKSVSLRPAEVDRGDVDD